MRGKKEKKNSPGGITRDFQPVNVVARARRHGELMPLFPLPLIPLSDFICDTPEASRTTADRRGSEWKGTSGASKIDG